MSTNGTATTWGQTFTVDDLNRLEREIAAMPQLPWTLIAPDGRAWQTTEPRELLRVLAGACYPLFPAGVTASDDWKPGATVRVNAERIEAFSPEAKAAFGVARGPDCALICQEHKAGRDACKVGACARPSGVQAPCVDCNQPAADHINGCPIYPPLGTPGVTCPDGVKGPDHG